MNSNTCHILSSVCIACGIPFSTKIKLCNRGLNGQLCVKPDLGEVTNVCVQVDANGRKHVNLGEILTVFTVKNRNPHCPCGGSMHAPNSKDAKELEYLSEDEEAYMETQPDTYEW